MNNVALIIIYNHQYNENIEILENIYKNRFSNIYHLMPFYNDEKNNVIAVYENSYYFQGYVAQGFKHFFKQEFEHYFFIADDLILNPIINENNYKKHLKLETNSCFLPRLLQLHQINDKEIWQAVSLAFSCQINTPGIEIKNLIPSYTDALKIFQKFNLKIKPLSFNQIWQRPSSINANLKKMLNDKTYRVQRIKSLFKHKKFDLPYPMVGSYADIFVVSSDAIKLFCYYCGIFAATQLFVEIGLPTALVLSAQKIITESDLKLQGRALWTNNDYKILDKYNNKLNLLLSDFPEDYLYLHPIKLSKWANKLWEDPHYFEWLNSKIDFPQTALLTDVPPFISNLAWYIYKHNIDLREQFSAPLNEDRIAFVLWFITQAAQRFEIPEEFIAPMRDSFTTWAQQTYRQEPQNAIRLNLPMYLWQSRADLQQAFPQFANSTQLNDMLPFMLWFYERAAIEYGLSQTLIRTTTAPFLTWVNDVDERMPPLTRFAAWQWQSRADLQSAFPQPTEANFANYMQWLHKQHTAELMQTTNI